MIVYRNATLIRLFITFSPRHTLRFFRPLRHTPLLIAYALHATRHIDAELTPHMLLLRHAV